MPNTIPAVGRITGVGANVGVGSGVGVEVGGTGVGVTVGGGVAVGVLTGLGVGGGLGEGAGVFVGDGAIVAVGAAVSSSAHAVITSNNTSSPTSILNMVPIGSGLILRRGDVSMVSVSMLHVKVLALGKIPPAAPRLYFWDDEGLADR